MSPDHSCLRFMLTSLAIGLAMVGFAVGSAYASPVVIEHASFRTQGGERWSVDVTLRHPDTGWEHYADLWLVETVEGRELGRRVLLHPHETEQPFTRSASISIPANLKTVVVRAGCTVDGVNSAPLIVDLTKPGGTGFEVR